MVEREELAQVQAFIAEPFVDRLDEPVVRGFARPGEIQRDTPRKGPRVECLRGELRAVIHRDRLQPAVPRRMATQRRRDVGAGVPLDHL